LQFSLWPVLVLLLALAMPSVGPSGAQSDETKSNNTHINDFYSNGTKITGKIIPDNVTNLVDNVTKNTSSPFINGTETSSLNTNTTNIVINEVELNPRSSDSDHEWIELYNPTDVNVSIGDLEIRTSFKSASISLPSDATIDANGTYVVEIEGQMLSNTAESIVLVNGSGETIDQTPSLVDRSDDGRTWQRIPDGNDEWRFVAGTRGELNDPSEQGSATRSAGSTLQCLGTAGCAEGTVVRIVDGDTLYVAVNNTVYKIDLALTEVPSSDERGFLDSTSFTRSLCLGSNVLVDQDDKLLVSNTSIIAVVYCESANLNSELLDNDYATLDMSQCKTSEFADLDWAREHGC
jgi:endonuclease YncB( thermonuclease family)